MERYRKINRLFKRTSKKTLKALAEQAAEMRDKFLNLMGIETKKDDPTGSG